MKSSLRRRLGRAAVVSAAAGVLALSAAGVSSAAPGDLHGPFATQDDCFNNEYVYVLTQGVWADPNWDCILSTGPGGAGRGYYWEEAFN